MVRFAARWVKNKSRAGVGGRAARELFVWRGRWEAHRAQAMVLGRMLRGLWSGQEGDPSSRKALLRMTAKGG
jgi:hypothetical protein